MHGLKDTIRALKKHPHKALLLVLVILCLGALADFLLQGKARRTAVFSSLDGKKEIVEERMLLRTRSREADITAYVEDVILGPSSLEEAHLLNRGSAIESLLFRDNIVYLGLSEEAAIPPAEGGEVLRSLATLKQGVCRNFPYVKDVYIFIEGNESFY